MQSSRLVARNAAPVASPGRSLSLGSEARHQRFSLGVQAADPVTNRSPYSQSLQSPQERNFKGSQSLISRQCRVQASSSHTGTNSSSTTYSASLSCQDSDEAHNRTLREALMRHIQGVQAEIARLQLERKKHQPYNPSPISTVCAAPVTPRGSHRYVTLQSERLRARSAVPVPSPLERSREGQSDTVGLSPERDAASNASVGLVEEETPHTSERLGARILATVGPTTGDSQSSTGTPRGGLAIPLLGEEASDPKTQSSTALALTCGPQNGGSQVVSSPIDIVVSVASALPCAQDEAPLATDTRLLAVRQIQRCWRLRAAKIRAEVTDAALGRLSLVSAAQLQAPRELESSGTMVVGLDRHLQAPAPPHSSVPLNESQGRVVDNLNIISPTTDCNIAALFQFSGPVHFAATRIQRVWKLQRWRRSFVEYSANQLQWVGSLEWLQQHNLLYGTELASGDDVRCWLQQRALAPLDREVDPWGSERLFDHLNRVWYGVNRADEQEHQRFQERHQNLQDRSERHRRHSAPRLQGSADLLSSSWRSPSNLGAGGRNSLSARRVPSRISLPGANRSCSPGARVSAVAPSGTTTTRAMSHQRQRLSASRSGVMSSRSMVGGHPEKHMGQPSPPQTSRMLAPLKPRSPGPSVCRVAAGPAGRPTAYSLTAALGAGRTVNLPMSKQGSVQSLHQR